MNSAGPMRPETGLEAPGDAPTGPGASISTEAENSLASDPDSSLCLQLSPHRRSQPGKRGCCEGFILGFRCAKSE